MPSFDALPSHVSMLQNLTMLYISPVWFTELPEALFRLEKLKNLTLEPESHWPKRDDRQEGLKKLSPEISRLTKL